MAQLLDPVNRLKSEEMKDTYRFAENVFTRGLLAHSQEIIPTTNPVKHEARVAPISAFPLTEIKSPFLSGIIVPMPLSRIPTLDKFANPHKA